MLTQPANAGKCYINKKCTMNPLDSHEILMWLAIIALIVFVSMTGMCINRVYIHRAHRKALAELRRRAIESAINEERKCDKAAVAEGITVKVKT